MKTKARRKNVPIKVTDDSVRNSEVLRVGDYIEININGSKRRGFIRSVYPICTYSSTSYELVSGFWVIECSSPDENFIWRQSTAGGEVYLVKNNSSVVDLYSDCGYRLERFKGLQGYGWYKIPRIPLTSRPRVWTWAGKNLEACFWSILKKAFKYS